MDLLKRYLAGEHRQVWDELLSSGAQVRNAALIEEANLVLRETMVRIRHNIKLLISGLERDGFELGRYPDGEQVPAGYDAPLVPPPANVDEQIREIERLAAGPVPLSLAGFWRYVGSVNLVGSHPDWPDGTDPLWVEIPEATIAEYPEWLDRRNSNPDEPPFTR